MCGAQLRGRGVAHVPMTYGDCQRPVIARQRMCSLARVVAQACIRYVGVIYMTGNAYIVYDVLGAGSESSSFLKRMCSGGSGILRLLWSLRTRGRSSRRKDTASLPENERCGFVWCVPATVSIMRFQRLRIFWLRGDRDDEDASSSSCDSAR